MNPRRSTPPRASRRASVVVAIIDGAARGNPGPAAYGVLFTDSRGHELGRLAQAIGRATNNVAEYRALLAALDHAREQGWQDLLVRTDSELLARQLEGRYRVRDADLKALHQEAQQRIAAVKSFRVEAVPRKATREADRLANRALDRRPVLSQTRDQGGPEEFEGRPVPGDQRGTGKTLSPLAPAPRRQRVHAVYESGILRPLEKLQLAHGEEVEVEIHRKPSG